MLIHFAKIVAGDNSDPGELDVIHGPISVRTTRLCTTKMAIMSPSCGLPLEVPRAPRWNNVVSFTTYSEAQGAVVTGSPFVEVGVKQMNRTDLAFFTRFVGMES